MSKFLIIVNPIARRGNGARSIPAIRTAMTRLGADFELVQTEQPGHAIEIAQQAAAGNYGTVVAVVTIKATRNHCSWSPPPWGSDTAVVSTLPPLPLPTMACSTCASCHNCQIQAAVGRARLEFCPPLVLGSKPLVSLILVLKDPGLNCRI